MFGNKFHVTPVNAEKGIYKIRPTKGTIVKAFAPSIVLLAVGILFGVITADDASVVEEYDPNKKKFVPKD